MNYAILFFTFIAGMIFYKFFGNFLTNLANRRNRAIDRLIRQRFDCKSNEYQLKESLDGSHILFCKDCRYKIRFSDGNKPEMVYAGKLGEVERSKKIRTVC